MKLLHVGNDRELAYRLASALQRAGREVTVAWFGRASDAMRWVCDNPDFAALVIEDHAQNQGCSAFIREVRGLGLTAPIVAVSMKGADAPLAALRAGADDYVVNGQSLFPDLVGAVVRNLHRANGLAAKRPVRCLYLGDPTLARQSFQNAPRAIQIVESGPAPTGDANPIPVDIPAPGEPLPFDVVLAEHGRPRVDIFAILKDAAVRRFQVPVIFVVEWDEELIVPALRMGAADYVLKTRAALEALSFRIDRVRSGSIVARELADLLRQQGELRASLEDAATARTTLELQLADAEITVRTAADRHAAMTKTAAELHEQQAQYQTTLARTTEDRDSLAQQLKDATAVLDEALRKEASDAALAEESARREAELAGRLEDEAAARRALQQQLTQSERRGVEEREAVTRERSQRRAEFDARLAQESEAREAVQRQLKDVSTALQQIKRARSADATAAAERLAQREHELSEAIAETAATRDVLEQRLTAAEDVLQQTEKRAREDREALLSAAAQREAETNSRLDREAALRAALDEKLRDADAVIRTAAEEHAALTKVVAEVTEERTRAQDELVPTTADRDRLSEELREVAAALEQTERAKVSEVAAVTERFARREVRLIATIAETTASRDALDARLVEAQAALHQAEEHGAAERESSLAAASKREAEVEAQRIEEAAVRHELEQKVSATEDALRAAVEQHASEMASAFERLAADRAQHSTELAQSAAVRSELERELNEVSLAVEQSKQARASEGTKAAEQLARREAELTSAIDDIAAKLAAVEHRLIASEAALEQAEQRALDDHRAAAQETVRRKAEFESQLQRETAARRTFEQKLADSEATLREAAGRHAAEVARLETQLAEMAAARKLLGQQASDLSTALEDTRRARTQEAAQAAERLSRREAELTSVLAAYRAEAEAKLAETNAARETLQQHLKDSLLAHEETKKAWTSDAAAAADRLTRREAELTATLAGSTSMRESLEALVSQRDAQLKEQAGSHAAAQETLQTRAANRIADLRQQLDETLVRQRIEFERFPSSMLRSAPDGTIEQVNDAMAAMLRHRTPDEVKRVDFANSVFESPGEWRSLIDRCIQTDAAQSLETRWKRKDGVRLPVRLLAVASPSGHIIVVVEDLMKYRELEEKLRRSEPMEAVGRLASEVAATCDSLLRDVSHDGHAWLAAIGDDSKVRQQGELLLNDVTRAASYLRQLDAYGKKQADSLDPVDLARTLRNLTPVLKRVAGNDIEFVLPKASSPIHLDVELDRVERIFVNVAAYSRERMPFGGRLMFEFGEVMVGGDGGADQPDVQPGPHALITVTAVRYAVWSDAARMLPRVSHASNAPESPDRVGVDLGAIQALIRGCGGRLWLTAEPPGDMVLKIHLPRLMLEFAAVPRARMPHPMRRWLHVGR